MAWLFGQIWVFCAVSFLLGGLVTWLLVARPTRVVEVEVAARRPVSRSADPPSERPVEPERPPPAPRPVNPALAALDTRGGRVGPPVGRAATGALDMLGVGGGRPDAGPGSPAEDGPADAAPPTEAADEEPPPRS